MSSNIHFISHFEGLVRVETASSRSIALLRTYIFNVFLFMSFACLVIPVGGPIAGVVVVHNALTIELGLLILGVV
ncbi:MAG: hypothetical protein ACMG6E_09615 [Candidatus Roizmanbacteria bacterium]